jgi:catechol 2,3-dioxygenase-like lactoylglutathione lyase family enzyme
MKSSRDVIIRTDEWGRAVKFYGRVLGLRASGRGRRIVGFETGGFKLYVEKGEKHGPVFEFLVSDVPAAKARLLAAGCRLIEEDPGLPRCYVRDPFGLTFNIGQARPSGPGKGSAGKAPA